LDGLRGWASLYVVLHHIWQFAVMRPDAGELPRWFTVFTVLKPGSFGVTVFIVLSGYCLSLPVARAATPELAGGFGSFVRRRARRILPPYYATVALTILLLLAYPRLNTPTTTPWDHALPALTLESLVSHALLLHNLSPTLEWKLNPPLWSVALEWQIYFVFALLLVPLWRRAGLAVAAGVGILIGVLPLAFGAAFAHPWFIGSFSLGMAAAAVNFSPALRDSALVARIPWGVVALVSTLPATWALGFRSVFHVSDVVAELSLSVATAAFLVRATRALERAQTPRFLRALEHAWSAKLGAFSYSLYLVHLPVLTVLALSLADFSESALSMFVLLSLLGIPLMLISAYAFHRVFEKPFMTHPASRAKTALA
jgi:peptidoglycan/LPS O-acetylase OafA/YrhL